MENPIPTNPSNGFMACEHCGGTTPCGKHCNHCLLWPIKPQGPHTPSELAGLNRGINPRKISP